MVRNLALLPLALLTASCAAGPYPRVIGWDTGADGSVCKTEQLDPFMQRRQCVPQSYLQRTKPAEEYIPDSSAENAPVDTSTHNFGIIERPLQEQAGPIPERVDQTDVDDSEPAMDEATRRKLDELKMRLGESPRRRLQEDKYPAAPRRVQRTQPQQPAEQVIQPPVTSNQTAQHAAPAPTQVQSPMQAAPQPQVAPSVNRRPPNSQTGPVY